jgi:hypothetical protein
MQSSTMPKDRCALAHGLLNQLAAIVGNCDILADEASADSACLKRLAQIREIALGMATRINEYDCLGWPTRNATSEPTRANWPQVTRPGS